MKRPSRRFVWTLFALLLVAAGLLGLWIRMQPEPPRPPSPDVWVQTGVDGDLRTAPDGAPIVGWVYIGNDGGLGMKSGLRRPFVVIVPKGDEVPATLDRIRSRITGDHMRPVDGRYLYRTGDPVVTPSGEWYRYSTRWWKGATLPPAAK